jgi:VanZ family protein
MKACQSCLTVCWDFLRRWGPALVLMLAIFLFSNTPSEEIPNLGGWDRLVKKGGHMLGYALLALSLLRGLGRQTGWRSLGLALLAAALYAASDELHQSFVPGRHAAWLDVGIDSLGAAIGLLSARGFAVLRRLIFFGLTD